VPFGGGESACPEYCVCHVITLECIDLKSQGVSILALSVYLILWFNLGLKPQEKVTNKKLDLGQASVGA